MIRACDQFEKVWLNNKPYICGDMISVADIYAASELEQPGKIISLLYSANVSLILLTLSLLT